MKIHNFTSYLKESSMNMIENLGQKLISTIPDSIVFNDGGYIMYHIKSHDDYMKVNVKNYIQYWALYAKPMWDAYIKPDYKFYILIDKNSPNPNVYGITLDSENQVKFCYDKNSKSITPEIVYEILKKIHN